MRSPSVDVSVAHAVATVTLDRPAKRNALDRGLRADLWAAMNRIANDLTVHAVVLTGTDPAFCAGIDLDELADHPRDRDRSSRRIDGPRDANGTFRYIPEIDQPVIAAVNGPAVTGGFELALQCTLILSSDRASFTDTHLERRVLPGGGMTVLLAAAIGPRAALATALTGRTMTAGEAFTAGLVVDVVPHEDLLPRAQVLAQHIARLDPSAVRQLCAHYRALSSAAGADAGLRLEASMADAWSAGLPPAGAYDGHEAR